MFDKKVVLWANEIIDGYLILVNPSIFEEITEDSTPFEDIGKELDKKLKEKYLQ